MGRQISFYLSEQVQNAFLIFLKKNNFVFFNSFSQKIDEPEKEDVYSMYLFKQSYGNIFMCVNNQSRLDIIKSPVIEFCKVRIKEEQKEVHQGRLWIENRYYDEMGNVVKKENDFIKDYQKLVHWVKKNVPYQEIEGYGKEYVNDEIKTLHSQGYKLTI